jgi:hypothetical protein
MAFDNDDVLEEEDDEDLQKDPVSTMDMQVSDFLLCFSAVINMATRTTFSLSSASVRLAIPAISPPSSTK